MKELSIEEKAKAYDEAIKRAKSKIKNDKDHILYEDDVIEIFPELYDSEDEKIRKELIRAFKSMNSIKIWNGIERTNILAWLEKQGEQKPVNKVEAKFKVGDWVVLTAGDLSTTLQIANVDINKKLYWFNDGSYLPIVDEECLHLWTIEDAKDGDVLAFNDNIIVKFKDLYNATTFHSYCHIEDGTFDVSTDKLPDWWEGEGFHPATKEQRDKLEKAMTNAGYKWDEDKKEPIKL